MTDCSWFDSFSTEPHNDKSENIKKNKISWWKFLHFSHIVCKFPLELTEQNQTNSRMIFEILGFKTKRFSLDPDEPPIPTVISGNKK